MQKEIERVAPRTIKEYLRDSKDAIDVFRWIFREIVTDKSKRWLKRMMGSVVFMNLMQTLQPAAVSYIVNGLMSRNGNTAVLGLSVFLLCLALQKTAQWYYDRTRQHVMNMHWAKLEDRLTNLFLGKSLGQHTQMSSLLTPANIDKGKWKAMEIQRTLFFDGLPVLLNLTMSLACLFFLSKGAGFGILLIMLMYVIWSLYLNSEVARVCIPLDRKFRRLARRRSERFDRVERVKVCGKESAEVEEMSKTFESISVNDKAFWLRFINIAFVRSLLNALGLVSIMAWGTWLVWNGKLNIGLLFPLFAWTSRICENIWRLGDVEHELNWNIPAVKSMIEAVTIPPAIVDSLNAVDIDPKVTHEIRFEDVSHVYPAETKDSDTPAAVLGISFTIEKGQKVALLGASGAGKSTIMKKLLRYDDPTSGKILIDGIDLRNITQASWKQGIGYIAQQPQVLDGTVRTNLTYGMTDEERKNTSDEDLWKLMKLLQIDFGERLTEGLDTIVGRGGIKLSGGQAQRLMIGAAVIKKPWLLVVDEATSSLDSTTEKLVQRGLETVMSDSSTSALIVAHRLSSVRYLCDKFVILKAAKDVLPGESQVEAIADSFEELYEESPTFRQLADDQGIAIRELVEA